MAKKKHSVGIIGAGNIARHLKSRLEGMGDEVLFTVRRASYVRGEEELARGGLTLKEMIMERLIPSPDVVFVAIPTTVNSAGRADTAALGYILQCVELGIPIVTCEKGVFAYYPELFKYRGKIGYTATVGGGTQMLKFLRARKLNKGEVVRMDTVINGTLNFIFDEVSRGGRTLGEACTEAIHLGYAEPGAQNPLDLINGEMNDVLMKTCILFNDALAGHRTITPDDLRPLPITGDDLHMLSEKAGRARFVVSFRKGPLVKNAGVLCGIGFSKSLGGWHIYGGFRDTQEDHELVSWLPAGVGNALHIVQGDLGSDGKYTLTGPGAGPGPTTWAMLADMWELLGE